ncbi:MAG: type II secretion system secretin GspD [Deltaproteobacteria bacterium]|nr:type II secretion system secretin GspD [Deltaproteobacteria bacterium]
MRTLRCLRMGFFVLLLIAAPLGCAGTKPQLKGPPGVGVSQKQIGEPAREIAAVPREKEEAKTQEKAEVPPPPTPRLEGTTQTLPPASVRPPEPAKGSRFVLNFDNADLYEVIRVVAEMMKINYLIDPRVKGVVNIHTSGQITTDDIFPIFQSILKLNGATAVQKGVIYEIVPFGDAKKLYAPPSISLEPGKIPPEERYTIQIIPLKYIPVGEVSKMIKPFLSDGADIVEHPPHNILIIGDVASNVKKSLDIIGLFDVDIFVDMRVRIYPLLNADVNEIAKEMERIFSSLEVSLKSGRGVGITFTPIIRINSLLVVSSIPQVFDKVEKWLKELDKVPAEGTKPSVFVYYVQNGKAKDLADVLKQIYVPERKPEVKPVAPPTPALPRGVRPVPAPAVPPTPPKEEGVLPSGAVPEGEINIVVDETTNALIIRALPRDYKAILETIKKLDLYPKQVLIEVLLAEVTLDEATKYGLEFSTFKAGDYSVGMGGTAFLGMTPSAEAFSSGLRYSIASADKLTAAIHASAAENRLKVISSPHILASNNKEAKIQIGSSEPILTTTYTTPGATAAATAAVVATGIVEGTIEYKDIGVILSVTPRISDAKLVTLEISIEQSTVGQKDLGSLKNVPFFPKKTAKTSLSIMEGQTIVIGGLIEESKERSKAGVPFLSKIPILGALFGYHTNTDKAKETILLMTPHVITDLTESAQVTREFREKVATIKRELEKREKKKEVK